jgi:hypothetical protein
MTFSNGKSYMFYPYYTFDGTSAPTRAPSSEWGKPELLAKRCETIAGCIGFTSAGWFKTAARPTENWIRWTDNPSQGIYLREGASAGVALSRPASIVRKSTYTAGGKTYGFYQGFESRDGDIELAPEAERTVAKLGARCSAKPGCVGFNTLGFLKGAISSPAEWAFWSQTAGKGLYKRD